MRISLLPEQPVVPIGAILSSFEITGDIQCDFTSRIDRGKGIIQISDRRSIDVQHGEIPLPTPRAIEIGQDDRLSLPTRRRASQRT